MEKQKEFNFKLDTLAEVIRRSRKAKFIKRTLHAVCEGRHLTRKNLLTFRNFFDNIGEDLDKAKAVITMAALDDISPPSR
ncbi:MAG TPA: hypothetical protein VK568_00280 [Thermodesulfobacteriota bacterium]|nr:hypothetical protein [Thermodesulfobacteriota bacterium]